jgi:predicted transcriptional regulator
MNFERLESVLEQLGFLDKEIDLYVMSLKVGVLTAGQLAKKTGIKRSTVYYMLGNLVDKGLIKMKDVEGVAYYQAERPQKLFRLLDVQIEKVRKQKRVLSQSLPEFAQLVDGEDERIQYFKGKGAVRNMILGTPWETKETCSIWTPGIYDRLYGEDSLWLLTPDRIKRMNGRFMITDTPGSVRCTHVFHELSSPMDVRVYGYKEVETDILVYGDEVYLTQFHNEPSYVKIKDQFVADSYKGMFSDIWNSR